MSDIAIWIFACVGAFIFLAGLLRRDRLSLGLPVAYLLSLFLIHLPGAFTQVLTNQFDYDASVVELGIRFTAIGCLCFAAGVWLARYPKKVSPVNYYVDRRQFWQFCLVGGLFVQFGLRFLQDLPSIRSAIDRGSLLWTLGALLGLRLAISQANLKATIIWFTVAMVYPVLILLMAGFLSYGSATTIIVVSALVVSVRSRMKLIAVGCLVLYLGLSIFVNYFGHRTEFREVAWSGASTGERIVSAVSMFSDFQWFDPTNVTQLTYFNLRLNQNYFVGLSAARIEQGQVGYLYGRSIWEGVLALVPRFLWPEKPVFGGSGRIVADMTGLSLDTNTSWGVGNVMEFQNNFGVPGIVIGFLTLGFLIGWLDLKAAAADLQGDIGRLILFFLVGVALIQPGSSIVEMAGGAAAAASSGLLWKWLWQLWLWWNKQRVESRQSLVSR